MKNLSLTFFMLAVLSWPLGAESQRQKSGDGTMSMDGMMKECREHCQKTSKSLDKNTAMMRDAEQSNDPARMRAALNKSQKAMADMKSHMNMCMDMMGDMEGMHKGMGDHMEGMMDGKSQ